MRFDAEEEGLQFALSFGGDIEVLEPAALRDKVRAEAERLVQSYALPRRTQLNAGPG
jgi:predicted DNA-binding transcriptional regulator YafY